MHVTHSFNLPPLAGLEALLASAEAGSFSAAAELLGVTHGSISRRVATVEQWVGTSLFERHGRGVRLSPAGQRFAADARRALQGLEQSAARWRPRARHETVRLSALPSFAKLWIFPRLAELERDSNLHIDLVIEHKISDLDGREADLAIRYGRGYWDGVEASLLLSETLVPAGSPELVHRLGAIEDAHRLLDVPLIHDSDMSHWRSWFAQRGISYRPRWRDRKFEDYDTVLAAAAAGLGLVLARLPIAASRIEAQQLHALPFDPVPAGLAHFLILRTVEHRPHVLRLAEHLQRMFERDDQIFSAREAMATRDPT